MARASVPVGSRGLGSRPHRKAPDASQLEAELARLHSLGLGVALQRIAWQPDRQVGKLGEVLGTSIHIYVPTKAAALEVLRHEVLHHEVARCQDPFLRTLNAVLGAINQESYQRTEDLINRLTRLLRQGDYPGVAD